MPYIPLEEKLPGITGLLNYRKDTALPDPATHPDFTKRRIHAD